MVGSTLEYSSLSDKEKTDMLLAVEKGADFLATPYIRYGLVFPEIVNPLQSIKGLCNIACVLRSAADVRALKDIIKARGSHTCVLAKIAGKEALKNFPEILAVSDGIIVAR